VVDDPGTVREFGLFAGKQRDAAGAVFGRAFGPDRSGAEGGERG